MVELVYLNGSLVPRAEAKVSVFDYGFLYGYGLFETMRAYNGKIFRLERHLKRLQEGAQKIGLASMPPTGDLAQACEKTLVANGLTEARIRLTVSKGEADPFPGFKSVVKPTVVISARPYAPPSAEIYAKGYKALVSGLRHCRQSALPGVKSTNYQLNLLARGQAEAAGCDEALLLNEQGFITEGTISNVFFVRNNGLVTPPLDSGLLPGITRELVLEICRNMDIKVREKNIKLSGLGKFGEAFLTNSLMELMPLVAVKSGDNLTRIGAGKPGEVTGRLVSAYRRVVQKETA